MCVNRSSSTNRFQLYSPIHRHVIHAKVGTKWTIYRSLDLAAGVLSQHNLYMRLGVTPCVTLPWHWQLQTSGAGHKPVTTVLERAVTWVWKLVITRYITARIPGIGILCFNQCDSQGLPEICSKNKWILKIFLQCRQFTFTRKRLKSAFYTRRTIYQSKVPANGHFFC